MIEFEFELTAEERRQERRLNNHFEWPQWKTTAVVFLSILPSLLLCLTTGSFIVTVSIITLIVLLIGWMLFQAFPKDNPNGQRFHMKCDPEKRTVKVGQSIAEYHWSTYTEFSEADDCLILSCLDHHTLIPLRNLDSHQRHQLLSCAEGVRQESDSNQRVPLHKRFDELPDERIYQFRYLHDDLSNVGTTWNDLFEATPLKETSTNQWSKQLVYVFIFLIVLVGFILFPNDLEQFKANMDGRGLVTLLTLGIAFVLPFLILNMLGKIYVTRFNKQRKQPRIPAFENSIGLLDDGILIGHPGGTVLHHWKDIRNLYDNETCFGLRALTQEVVVIPKRILGNQENINRFSDLALELRRRHFETSDHSPEVVESGNPYQPPSG